MSEPRTNPTTNMAASGRRGKWYSEAAVELLRAEARQQERDRIRERVEALWRAKGWLQIEDIAAKQAVLAAIESDAPEVTR